MFTYLPLLISNVYTVFYTIYCILAYATLTLLIHIFVCIYSYSIPYLELCVLGICCGIVKHYLLDIDALSELEAQAFRYTRNNIC
jgi:hypothetical protein